MLTKDFDFILADANDEELAATKSRRKISRRTAHLICVWRAAASEAKEIFFLHLLNFISYLQKLMVCDDGLFGSGRKLIWFLVSSGVGFEEHCFSSSSAVSWLKTVVRGLIELLMIRRDFFFEAVNVVRSCNRWLWSEFNFFRSRLHGKCSKRRRAGC